MNPHPPIPEKYRATQEELDAHQKKGCKIHGIACRD